MSHNPADYPFSLTGIGLVEARADGPRQVNFDQIPLRLDPRGRNMGHEISMVVRDNFDDYVDSIVTYFQPQGVKVLDVGAASGFRAEQFARLGADVVAADFAAAQSEVTARNAGLVADGFTPVSFMGGDIADPAFTLPPGHFDIVHARSVLHFMDREQLGAVIEKIAGAIKPEGYFCAMMLTSPEAEDDRLIYTQDDKGVGFRDAETGKWYHRFSKVFASVQENGLQVDDVLVAPYPPGAPTTGQRVYALVAQKRPVFG